MCERKTISLFITTVILLLNIVQGKLSPSLQLHIFLFVPFGKKEQNRSHSDGLDPYLILIHR